MQSSSVKSEMYPIWAVSLLALFGCVDPVTSYNGLDYKGPLLKVIFQLCLYCGYVLMMSISIVSGVFGNMAIGLLFAITFVKGVHRSLGLVLPSSTRSQIGELRSIEPNALAGHGSKLKVRVPNIGSRATTMAIIHRGLEELQHERWLKVTANDITVIEDVCLGYGLSLVLQRRFLGMDTIREMEEKREQFEGLVRDGRTIDYERTLKAVEIELAFLYEVFFSSNEFLHYHEAKTSSFWALASFVGICLVGVATVIPGTMSSRYRYRSGTAATVVVDTTTADLVVTLVILVTLALLQLVQLLRCWASNWARVAFACKYCAQEQVRNDLRLDKPFQRSPETGVDRPRWWPWVWLKGFVVTRVDWFDNKYLWQDKLGQFSLLGDVEDEGRRCCRRNRLSRCLMQSWRWRGCRYWWICDGFPRMLGLQYIGQVLRELLASDTNGGSAVRLHDDLKASIAEFLGQIKSNRVGKEWSSLFVGNGVDASCLPYSSAPLLLKVEPSDYFSPARRMTDAYAFAHRVIVWHVATCYCEKAEQEEGAAGGGAVEDTNDVTEKNWRVAITLSKYCAYLVVSAPELLPGPSAETKRALKFAEKQHKGHRFFVDISDSPGDAFLMGEHWGKRLRNDIGGARRRSDDPWQLLALLWVQTLLYAAPYGDVQAHMQRLSQGGEFITHLWALLYHLGIDRWETEGEIKEEEDETIHIQRKSGETTTTSNAATTIVSSRRLKRAMSLPAGLDCTPPS
jgi:hypothetical protein